MPSSDWFWGTSKKSIAYSGWFFTLLGGFLIGGGVAIILIPRWILEGIMAINPTVGINAEPYAMINLFGAFAVMIGVLLVIFGIYVINRSLRTPVMQSQPPPPPPSMEKKYCRYCGTANNKDAAYCEKCGKKIIEG